MSPCVYRGHLRSRDLSEVLRWHVASLAATCAHKSPAAVNELLQDLDALSSFDCELVQVRIPGERLEQHRINRVRSGSCSRGGLLAGWLGARQLGRHALEHGRRNVAAAAVVGGTEHPAVAVARERVQVL
eukprot:CAMPEP_0202044116 /NCGR_PEP_ID=MMETSP0962-20130828/31545_1 /ASSEMBLY_ACC=CAM_ASM_000488 /TAXON_ID=4773 /ORGANISM="Schizochytrium aggregatum, Strain ATCC28209" /LENGTH=129 /DNA_ID=CAMNT_0048608621 /DNA_START=763 /DNA_END=1149 /DNA_ORIENTATION=+